MHHKNHNHFDNRPENLQVMSASEHSRHHSRYYQHTQRRILLQIERDAADPADIFWSMLAKIDLSEIAR